MLSIVLKKDNTPQTIMDNLRESQYPHQLQHSEQSPQFPSQEEWERQMLRFNPIESAVGRGPESASISQSQVRED